MFDPRPLWLVFFPFPFFGVSGGSTFGISSFGSMKISFWWNSRFFFVFFVVLEVVIDILMELEGGEKILMDGSVFSIFSFQNVGRFGHLASS